MRQIPMKLRAGIPAAQESAALTRIQAQEEAAMDPLLEEAGKRRMRSDVAGRLSSLISTEEKDTRSDPFGVGARNLNSLRPLLQQVQSGDDDLAKELFDLFSGQKDHNDRILEAVKTLKSQLDAQSAKLRNLPL
jgi:hypothetical protein